MIDFDHFVAKVYKHIDSFNRSATSLIIVPTDYEDPEQSPRQLKSKLHSLTTLTKRARNFFIISHAETTGLVSSVLRFSFALPLLSFSSSFLFRSTLQLLVKQSQFVWALPGLLARSLFPVIYFRQYIFSDLAVGLVNLRVLLLSKLKKRQYLNI